MYLTPFQLHNNIIVSTNLRPTLSLNVMWTSWRRPSLGPILYSRWRGLNQLRVREQETEECILLKACNDLETGGIPYPHNFNRSNIYFEHYCYNFLLFTSMQSIIGHLQSPLNGELSVEVWCTNLLKDSFKEAKKMKFDPKKSLKVIYNPMHICQRDKWLANKGGICFRDCNTLWQSQMWVLLTAYWITWQHVWQSEEVLIYFFIYY